MFGPYHAVHCYRILKVPWGQFDRISTSQNMAFSDLCILCYKIITNHHQWHAHSTATYIPIIPLPASSSYFNGKSKEICKKKVNWSLIVLTITVIYSSHRLGLILLFYLSDGRLWLCDDSAFCFHWPFFFFFFFLFFQANRYKK